MKQTSFYFLYLPILVFISGMAGLIYEVLWMRMLIRVFGITLHATSTIISVYMGGVSGVLFAGFVAIGTWGEYSTLAIAAGLDLMVGLAFLFFNRGLKNQTAAADPEMTPAIKRSSVLILTVAALSGFCALAFEVLLTRLLILLLGTSVYAFSIMLALYLMGIALGSLVLKSFLDRVPEIDLRPHGSLESCLRKGRRDIDGGTAS